MKKLIVLALAAALIGCTPSQNTPNDVTATYVLPPELKGLAEEDQ